ncbi:MAG: polysaccharide biosynthesis tyrosine autokinase [Fibrobacterota bacterium]
MRAEKNRTDFDFKEYLSIVLRQKLSLIIIFASIMAPLVFYVKSTPDSYFTKSQLVIEDLKSQTAFMPQVMQSTRSFNFYQGIFRSRSFLQAILDTLGKAPFKGLALDTTDETIRTYISGVISLRTTEYESFIEISSVAQRPQLAYDLANSATHIFKRMCRLMVAEETENTVRETENQLTIIRDKLETAERDFRQFSERLGGSGMSTTAELKHLQEQYYSIKNDRANKEAVWEADQNLLRALEKRIEPQNGDQKKTQEFLDAQRQLREKEKEKQRLEALGLTLNSSSPLNQEIAGFERQIIKLGEAQEKDRVDAKVLNQWQKMRKIVVEEEMELEGINNKLKVYERKIDQYKRAHPDELSQTLELARLERSRKVYEDTYNVLLEKVEVAKIKRAAETGGLSIIDSVYYPDKAMPKNEAVYYIVGVIVSLLLGLGFIFLREVLDTTVKSNDDLEHAYNIPIIGTIPHIDIAKKDELQIKRRSSSNANKEVVTTYPKELIDFYKDESVIAESYRSLRTNLFFTSPDNPLRSLIVTSSGPHEGKSLTASNLSLACAQMGKKVLLIDADLRRPILHHLFQHSRENGFTDLFIGKEIHEVVKPTGIENLSLITAGRFTPNPSELLASRKIEKVIELLKTEFELVVFDTPPVMAVTDAPLLSTKVDGVVLVIKAYTTDKHVLERSVASLQNVNAHMAGFVLNDINLSHRYASYGYYKYYYHYYRSQKD